MFEAVDPAMNRVKRMGIAKMRRHRDALVDILEERNRISRSFPSALMNSRRPFRESLSILLNG